MARARNIKPGFFTNELLVELSFEYRLLFIGLWTLADKDGRLEDRPKRIKMNVFPADNVDVDAGLSDLQRQGFLTRYVVDGVACIQIINWDKHQSPHHTEKASVLPPFDNGGLTVKQQKQDGGNPPDSLIHRFTDSPIPESSVVESGDNSPSTTTAGRVCARLRQAGVASVNPSNPKLLALLAAGLTEAELADLAAEPASKGKGFAWLLAAAEGRRRDAAQTGALPQARASPAYRTARQEAADTIAGLTGRAGNGNHGSGPERDITGESSRVA